MMRLNWNRERWRTRDRLLEYDSNIYPMVPHTAGLQMVYPWETLQLGQLATSLLKLAKQYGFTGSEDLLFNRMFNGNLYKGTLTTFPIPGDENCLYLDTETDILYYFKATTETVYAEHAAQVGAIIVGHSIIEDTEEIITYLYIPIRALPIENTIFNSGDAAEYID